MSAHPAANVRPANVRLANVRPAIIVIAKSPVAGRVKTRCSPPCTPVQAAALAEAALIDTLTTVVRTSATRIVLALDGEPREWMDDRFEVHPQCAGTLGDRLDHAFRTVDQPALLIGMDTPQVTVALLEAALEAFTAPDVDALVGPSADGGFWALGLKRTDEHVCASVPMSRDDTCRHLRRQLQLRSMHSIDLPTLIDVDDFATARCVAAAIPGSSFARTIDAISADLGAVSGGRR